LSLLSERNHFIQIFKVISWIINNHNAKDIRAVSFLKVDFIVE